MITLRHRQTGETQIVSGLGGIDPTAWEQLALAPPSSEELAAGALKLVAGAWAPGPKQLTGLQIVALYTPAQHARARRMLGAVYPAGHALAGQFVDPDGLVQRLLDATLAMPGTISTDDPRHVNGTALYRSLGIIESDAEAARILAGIPAPGM